jgi:CheY-like chemotaxis protein
MSSALSSTILNVHPDATMRRARSAMLRGLGYAVAEAASSLEALGRLKVLRPALVLLTADASDTGIDEVVEAVRRDHHGATVLQTVERLPTKEPSLQFSAAEPMRADLVLAEPVQPEALLSAMKALLRLGTTERALASARSVEAVDRFAIDFVHDFNNLITAIAGNLELILARPGDARCVRWAENALEAAQQASRLTSQRLRPASSPDAGVPPAEPAARPRGGRILIVDDETHVRSYMADLLLGLGYDTLEADGGASALAALETRVPDLMIVDFAMPGMTGAELALRVLGRAPEARILFMTGHADTVALDSIGPDVPILKKPFRSEDLAAAVQEALSA